MCPGPGPLKRCWNTVGQNNRHNLNGAGNSRCQCCAFCCGKTSISLFEEDDEVLVCLALTKLINSLPPALSAICLYNEEHSLKSSDSEVSKPSTIK